jgi:hypothetical protein
MRAGRRVPLGFADLVDGPVGEGEVDFVGRRAGLLGSQAQVPEQGLGDPMVTLVLLEGPTSLVREAALAAEPRDEPQLLERTQVSQGRGWAHPEPGRDVLEARALPVALPDPDHPERFDLTMGQLLQRLHERRNRRGVYIGHPNY